MDKSEVVNYLYDTRLADNSFRVIDLGPAANPWSRDVVDAIVDRWDAVGHVIDCWPPDPLVVERSKECCAQRDQTCFDELYSLRRCCNLATGEPRPQLVRFGMDMSRAKDYDMLLAYVLKLGKFDFAICSHVIEDLGRPQTVLEMLPQIAKAGFIAVPSKYMELAYHKDIYNLSHSLRYRGSLHHRWIYTLKNGLLHALPKLSFLDHDPSYDAFIDTSPAISELRIWWNGSLPYQVLNSDYLGPDEGTVFAMYREAIAHDDFDAPRRDPAHALSSHRLSM